MNTSVVNHALILIGVAALSTTGMATTARVLPTAYEAGHFYVTPEAEGGQKLRLIVDTGGGGFGGMYWISAAAARRLQLTKRSCGSGQDKVMVANLPDWLPGLGLPPPHNAACGDALLVFPKSGINNDGQLGAAYLDGRIWTFDYPRQHLTLDDATWHPAADAHATRLGFQRDAKGRLTSGFARITLRVDGQSLPMLLDTGATAHPTAAGEKASGTPTVGGYGVTSYITTSMLDRWHARHPDWRVVEQGDDLTGASHPMRLIEVPSVEIADWSVGPVWFTERPDPNFHEFMAQWMDKVPEGAVGGNVFRHFVMTIDYPHAVAYFRCVTGCKAVAIPPRAP